MNYLENYFNKLNKDFNLWVTKHYFQLALFNIVIILLALLRSAGYFEPYFLLTVNSIVFTGLFLSILLLETESNVLFLVALFFLLFGGILKIFHIDVWAERTIVYSFQAIFVAILKLIAENVDFRLSSAEGKLKRNLSISRYYLKPSFESRKKKKLPSKIKTKN